LTIVGLVLGILGFCQPYRLGTVTGDPAGTATGRDCGRVPYQRDLKLAFKAGVGIVVFVGGEFNSGIVGDRDG